MAKKLQNGENADVAAQAAMDATKPKKRVTGGAVKTYSGPGKDPIPNDPTKP